jgi:hypothetical protein
LIADDFGDEFENNYDDDFDEDDIAAVADNKDKKNKEPSSES